MWLREFYILLLPTILQQPTCTLAVALHEVGAAENVLDQVPIAFLSGWNVLGPFRLGTRGINI